METYLRVKFVLRKGNFDDNTSVYGFSEFFLQNGVLLHYINYIRLSVVVRPEIYGK